MAFFHRWQQLKNNILIRPEPHTLVSWRFLLPGQNRAIQLHRKVFLGAYPGRPRWQWALIAIYSSTTWLLFFSWQQIFLCMKNYSQKLTVEFAIPAWRQLFDLLKLALLHGIPPGNYYDDEYRLFCRPGKQWLEYIYLHEFMNWHQVLSDGVSLNTLDLMQDKRAFAEEMVKHGIASVKTADFLTQAEKIEAERIFIEKPLFLKPNAGSRGEGCLTLSFDSGTGNYRLIGDEVKGDILDEINWRVQQQDYLVQPLLQNHPMIMDLCGTSKLAPLRLVTGIIRREPSLLFASMYIPCLKEDNTCWWLDIDLETGKLFYSCDTHSQSIQRLLQRIGGKKIPFLQETVDICLNAHRKFSDLPTIGWDVAITSTGVKLLEGNVNWAIEGYQFNEPALNTALLEVYR